MNSATVPPVICVGELYTDIVMAGLDAVPGASREVQAHRFHVSPGGGAAISAVALARLRHPTWLVARAGGDGLAQMTLEALKSEGVHVRAAQQPPEGPGNVTVSIAVPEEWGHAPPQGRDGGQDRALITFRGAGVEVPLGEVRRALDEAVPSTGGGTRGPCGHVHYAGGDPVQAGEVAGLARTCGATASWDLGWEMASRFGPQVMKVLRGVGFDVVFCNAEEARALTGCEDAGEALGVLGELVRVAVVKLGKAGAMLVQRASSQERPRRLQAAAPRVEAVDTTGAGDAFCGGFLYGFVRGWPLQVALEMGVWVASLSTRRLGGIDGLPDVTALRRAVAPGAAAPQGLLQWLDGEAGPATA